MDNKIERNCNNCYTVKNKNECCYKEEIIKGYCKHHITDKEFTDLLIKNLSFLNQDYNVRNVLNKYKGVK